MFVPIDVLVRQGLGQGQHARGPQGQPAVHPMLTLTLSCDHRAVNGAIAAQFLDALAALIEEPLRGL